MFIGAKLAGAAGAGAHVVFFGLVVLNKSRILLNKSQILILHPHFSGPFGANVNWSLYLLSYDIFDQDHRRK